MIRDRDIKEDAEKEAEAILDEVVKVAERILKRLTDIEERGRRFDEEIERIRSETDDMRGDAE